MKIMNTEKKQYDNEKRFVLFTNEKTKPEQADMTGEGQYGGTVYRLAVWDKQPSGGRELSGKVSLKGSYTQEGELVLKPNGAKPEGSRHPDWKGELKLGGRKLLLAAWSREGRKGPFLSGSIEEPRPAEGADTESPF